MGNAGKWERWYAKATERAPYGDATSYQAAEKHVQGLAIEDWGCGTGWFQTIHAGPYRGVDGSWSRFADVVADLAIYRSMTDAVLLRHVLEHNYEWRAIAANAFASAPLVVVVLFTPIAEEQTEIAWNNQIGIPDLALPLDELAQIATKNGHSLVDHETLRTATQYKAERVLVFKRQPAATRVTS